MNNLDLFPDQLPQEYPNGLNGGNQATLGAGMILMMMQEPLTIHRAYISLTRSVAAGLYLTQCTYVANTDDVDAQGGWFYRATEEWTALTGLSETEQRIARRRLKEMEILEESREDSRLWVRLNWDALALLLDQNARTLFSKALADDGDADRAA